MAVKPGQVRPVLAGWVTPITSTFFFVTSFTSLHFACASKYFMYIYHIYYYKLCEMVCAAQFLVNFSMVCLYTSNTHDQFYRFKIRSCQLLNRLLVKGDASIFCRTHEQIKFVKKQIFVRVRHRGRALWFNPWTIKGMGWRRTLKLHNNRDALFGNL